MSSGDLRRRRERGYTALEMTLAVVLVAMMTLVVERTVAALSATERMLRAVVGGNGKSVRRL